MRNKFFSLLAALLLAAGPLLAQADQESPYDTNTPVEKQSSGSGLIWIALGLVVLGVIFVLLRRRGDRGTSSRLHKY